MWIARDENNELWMFQFKPFQSNDVWLVVSGLCYSLPIELYPEVSWEDEEPRELVLK